MGPEMQKIVRVVGVAMLLGSAPLSALAADMPMKAPPAAPAPYSWTGFYIGLNAGGGWSVHDGPNSVTNNIGASVLNIPNVSPQGFFGGVQAGYNWQFQQIVLGVEGDVQAANLQDDNNVIVTGNNFVLSRNLNYFDTARGRVGWTFDQLLVYGTGGWASAHFKRSNVLNGVDNIETPATQNGYAVGGGIELAFLRHWSVKLEYLYLGFGNYTPFGAVVPPNGITVTGSPQNNSVQTVRFGINYKFGPDGIVAKY